jgi:hypothetical protein
MGKIAEDVIELLAAGLSTEIEPATKSVAKDWG